MILFIYLREGDRDRDSEREHNWGGKGGAGSPLSREPNYAGLNSRTQDPGPVIMT